MEIKFLKCQIIEIYNEFLGINHPLNCEYILKTYSSVLETIAPYFPNAIRLFKLMNLSKTNSFDYNSGLNQTFLLPFSIIIIPSLRM